MKIISRCVIIVSFLSLLCGGACSRQGNDLSGEKKTEITNEKLLRLNMQAEPMSLDPRRGDRRSQVVLRMLFEGLTRISPENEVTPGMAEEIAVSDDLQHYTFHLREAFWSDGSPVTAADFEYAWKEMLSPEFDSPFAYAFYDIKNAEKAKKGEISIDAIGVRAADERTLDVELEHPSPHFLYLLANPFFSPVNYQTLSSNPHWHREGGSAYICNGPFRLETWQHGREISVKKNPYYWDAPAVKLDKIRLGIVSDPNTVLELFERGELDWAGEPLSELPLSALDRLRDEGRLQMASVGGIFQLKFNVEKPPLGSTNLRKALAAAINRRSLIDNVLKGGEQVATSVLPPALTLGGGSLPDGDVEQAKHYLNEALVELGCTQDELPALTLSYAAIEGHKSLAQAIQQQWNQALGLSVNLEGMEWNTYFSRMTKGEVQIGGAPWFSWSSDPIYNLEHVKSKSARYNSTRWENPNYVALLDLAAQEADIEKRRGHLRDAEALVIAEVPLCPLYVTTFKYVAKDDVSGVFISGLGQVDFKWASRS